jgi:hypothetical protein
LSLLIAEWDVFGSVRDAPRQGQAAVLNGLVATREQTEDTVAAEQNFTHHKGAAGIQRLAEAAGGVAIRRTSYDPAVIRVTQRCMLKWNELRWLVALKPR